jgi:integrase/recombinase XerD
MTPLRKKMIEDLRLKGMAKTSEKLYVFVASLLARHHGRSPADLDYSHVREFLLDLRQRGRSHATVANYWSALRFLFVVTLGRPDFAAHVPRPRRNPQLNRVPPTIEEIRLILAQARSSFDRAFFQTCYGAGLRLNEALCLHIRDVDSANALLHIRNGKGGKIRAVHLAPELLDALRAYWREVRPTGVWLFPARTHNARPGEPARWADHPPHASTLQRRFRAAVLAAGLHRDVTLHDLRRAYATHLLERGAADLRKIQVALGHSEPSTTALYAGVSVELIRTIPSPLSFL